MKLITDVLKNCDSVRNKNVKITKVFEKLEHLKNKGVIFSTEKIGLVIVKIWHQLQNSANLAEIIKTATATQHIVFPLCSILRLLSLLVNMYFLIDYFHCN
jgi:hypothetical protein